jgi:hypothetical protein
VSSQSCKCNQLKEDGRIDVEYLVYCLRRCGYWPERRLSRLAGTVSKKGCVETKKTRVRVLSIGVAKTPNLWLPQITIDEILRYMREDLFGCYDLPAKMVVSDHKQWHPLVCEVYRQLRGHKTRMRAPEEIVEWLFPGGRTAQAPKGDGNVH